MAPTLRAGMLRGVSKERLVLVALGLAALARLVAATSTWPLDWRADDVLLLASAREGGLPLERAHLSAPRDLVLLACARLDVGPWLPRALALAAHLAAGLLLVPRLARRLGLDAWTGRAAGLFILALPATFEPLAWPCTCAYPLLECSLLGLACAHLAALDGVARARAASVGATLVALLTWELGASAPLVVLALSWARGRTPREAAADVAPHLALVLAWAAVKLALGSVALPLARDPVRVAGNVAFTPLLLLSPLPLRRELLTSLPGALLAVGALALLALAARRAGDRAGRALAALPWVPLLPLLAGPGPESRNLLLAAPWAALLLARAAPRASWPLVAAVVVWSGCAGATSLLAASRWREADREARAVVDGVLSAARARGAREVAVVDAPNRLPGWGPTWKVHVWSLGLAERLRPEGVVVVAQAPRAPVDPERHGLRLDVAPLTTADLAAWRARGALVVAWDPATEAARVVE